MKKAYMITSVLMLLALFASSQSKQNEIEADRIDSCIHQNNTGIKALGGVVFVFEDKHIFEYYLGTSKESNITRINNLQNFRMGSFHTFDFVFGFEIVVFISEDIYEFLDKIKDYLMPKRLMNQSLVKDLINLV